MKKHLLFTGFYFASLILHAQAPSIQWQKSLGGTGSELATSVRQTTDGGYILAGYSTSVNGDLTANYGAKDFWIVKLDSTGSISWQKNFGGSLDEEANSIQQTTDGGYIAAGYSKSNDGVVSGNHGNEDYWIIKITSEGTLQWEKSFGGTARDIANSIQQTSDGGYILCGNTESNDGDITSYHSNTDYWILKVDSSGAIQWQKTLGGNNLDHANAVEQTTDGGFIVAGISGSVDGDVTGTHNGSSDFWIVKLNSAGAIQWQKCFGGSSTEEAMSIQQTTDEGYIVAGYTMSNDGDVTGYYGPSEDMWVVKTDSLGILQWQKVLGGSGSEVCRSICQTSDGGYVLTGPSASNDFDVTGNHGCRDAWVAKLNNSGTIQWQKALGGSACEDASGVIQTADGGYVVAALSDSNDGDVTGNHGGIDDWIVKLSPFVGIEENSFINLVTIYPNPNNGQFYLTGLEGENTIKIFDIAGRLIYQAISMNDKCRVDLTGIDKGIYFCRIINSTELMRQEKLIVE